MNHWHRLLFLAPVLIVLLWFGYSAKKIISPSSPPGCQPLDLSGEYDPTQTTAYWQGSLIPPLLALEDTLAVSQKNVLGAATDKWIEIDLSDQTLTARQGDGIFLTSKISSGLWNRTPVGEYHIWYKIRSTKMEGGSRLNNTYYYLPNVPYAMFFKGDYGIHGTYWHSNFGTRMSHGCVNAPTNVAEKLFYWTDPPVTAGKKIARADTQNPGTRVVIHD